MRVGPLVVLALLLVAACGERRRRAPSLLAPVTCGRATLLAEVAADPESQARGLMHRRRLEPDGAMLLVNGRDAPMGLGMKDTYIPLSAAFLDATGTILNIVDMDPFDETTIHRSAGPVRYALETHRGWFAEKNLGPGDRCEVRLPEGL
jgi:uncharacterized protein